MDDEPTTPPDDVTARISTLERRAALLERVLVDLIQETAPMIRLKILEWAIPQRDLAGRENLPRNEFHRLIQLLETPTSAPGSPFAD